MIRINDVKITPNVTTVNQSVTIEVQIIEANWNTVKVELSDWEHVKAYKNWQEIKDF